MGLGLGRRRGTLTAVIFGLVSLETFVEEVLKHLVSKIRRVDLIRVRISGVGGR